MSGLAALSGYRGKRDFPYNTKQGCFGNEKNGKQDHAPVGWERRGAGAHWDCGKGNIPTARFHNAAPGPWRLRDYNQPPPKQAPFLGSPSSVGLVRDYSATFPQDVRLSSLVLPLSTPSTNTQHTPQQVTHSHSAERPLRNQ